MSSSSRRPIWIAAGAGVVFGAVVQLLNTHLSGVANIGDLIESRAAWCALPFFLGATAATRKTSAIAGFTAVACAILAYYLVRCASGIQPWRQFLLATLPLIIEGALVIGTLFGILGHRASSTTPNSRLWQMIIPAIFAVEAALDLVIGGPDTFPAAVSAVGLIAACTVLCALVGVYANERRRNHVAESRTAP